MSAKLPCLLLTSMVCLLSAHTVSAQRGGVQQPQLRAAAGDTVWILLNHVKPDKREQFERFTYEILLPAVEKVAATDPQMRDVRMKTRVLEATRANEDGTYTYVYLADPYIPGADYSFNGLFSKVYSPEEAEQHLRMFRDAIVGSQVLYPVVQSRQW